MSQDDLHNRTTSGPNGTGGAADAVDALLDRVTSAVRDTPVPDGPDEQTLAQTLAALRAAQTFPIHRKQKMKPIIKLAIAACVGLIAGLVFLAVPISRNGVAFAKVLEQVNQAKSVRFKALITVNFPNQPPKGVASTMMISGNRLRQETPDTIAVFDFAKGEMLALVPKDKSGIRMKMDNMPAETKSMNLIEQFRTLKAEQARDLGKKAFDGRELHGFEVEQAGIGMTVWVDPKTETPARIEATIDIAAAPKMSAVYQDFQWDVPVDPALVSLDPPPGYELRSMTMDASLPQEKDLLDGMRTLVELNGGEFPATLDVVGMGKAFERYAMKSAPKKSDAEARKKFEAEMMPVALKIGRALSFVTPAIGNDWHYAGPGAKLDQPDRPVLWYKPVKSEKYHVIYADLTVKEVSADALPKIEAQKVKAGPSPFLPPEK